MTKPCAIYARVSTLAQSTDPWGSLTRQVEVLQETAARMGYVPLVAYEEKISGAADERPKFDHIMTMAEQGDISAIFVATFDRLTRTESMGEFDELKKRLRRIGCEVVTADQGLLKNDGSAVAELMSDMLAAVSKAERLKIRERTYGGKAAKAKAGGYHGHRTPYGYRSTYDATGQKSFEVDEAQAAVVRRIFADCLEGHSCSRIAAYLNAEGVPSPFGKRWGDAVVARILKNLHYIGRAQWLRTVSKDNPNPVVASMAFTPLVDDETFKAAQQALKLRGLRSPRGPYAPSPLAGLCYCGTCGRKMTFWRQHGRERNYYRCRPFQPHEAPESRCQSPTLVRAEVLEAAVLAFLREALPRELRDMADRQQKVIPIDAQKERKRIEEQIAKLKQEQGGLARLAARGDHWEAIANDELIPLSKALDSAKQALAELEVNLNRQNAGPEAIIPLIEVLPEVKPEYPERQARLFRGALVRLTVHNDAPKHAKAPLIRLSDVRYTWEV